jgi:hypothetical protein
LSASLLGGIAVLSLDYCLLLTFTASPVAGNHAKLCDLTLTLAMHSQFVKTMHWTSLLLACTVPALFLCTAARPFPGPYDYVSSTTLTNGST